MIRVTLLAGGVGGAKMAEGFAALDNVDLTVIGNVADDEEFHGLWVSPDIDTMLYTLSGRINRDQGWGLADEGRRALDMLGDLGAETWMFLGDRDFGLHIWRTERLRRGDSASEITRDIAQAFGVKPRILLPTDDRVQTRVKVAEGWLTFQEYFVRHQCKPEVEALRIEGLTDARPTQSALAALAEADLIVIAPSNPLVSIAPILGITGITENLTRAAAPVYAVSPLIAGRVVKGPADRMMQALGLRADAVGLAEGYRGVADVMVIDTADQTHVSEIETLGMQAQVTDIMMPDSAGKARLAGELVTAFQSAWQETAA
ncbi:MAG: 2-phospho-L-lactate transferase [Pseudomonadota bacterium]